MVCFETRLGCMDGGATEQHATKMIQANKDIFYLSICLFIDLIDFTMFVFSIGSGVF